MSYVRDTASDLVWNEDSQSYVPASDPPTPTEYTCNRDTTIDIYKSALDPDTVYNVTDSQTNFINIIRDTIWPVGSLYLGMMEVCPLAALFGTWVKVSSGRVLQGADETNPAGTTIEAGLPNLSLYTPNSNEKYGSEPNTVYNVGSISGSSNGIIMTTEVDKLYVKDDNNIVGKSTTVQPPALCVNIWQRVA